MDNRRTFLVADDDDRAREALQRVIERSGRTCLAVATGMEALTILRDAQVIIAHHDMPGLDGVELPALVATRHPAGA
ncbi:MAG: response regulator [Myxococcales bacterium]